MLLPVTACRCNFSVGVLAARSPPPEDGDSGCKGSPGWGLYLWLYPPLFFANRRTESGRGVRSTSLCPQFLSQWRSMPSILLAGKNNQTVIVSEIPKQVRRDRNVECRLLICLMRFLFFFFKILFIFRQRGREREEGQRH